MALEGVAGAEVATTGPQLYLRNSVSTGIADSSYRFGTPPGGTTLMCDWDGNGTDTPGVFVNGVWWISNATTGGFAQTRVRLRPGRATSRCAATGTATAPTRPASSGVACGT